jgi:hypothetical protein
MVFASVLGALTLTVGIGVATGAKLKTKAASTTVVSGDVGSATAQCEQGTKAISGGFEGEFGTIDDPPSVIPYMSRRDGGRKWTSAGFNFDDPGDITSFAYCRDQKVKTADGSTGMPAYADSATATATCPKGTKAISGGFDNPDFGYNEFVGPGIFPVASQKLGKRSWTVSGGNIGNDSGVLEASVNCSEGKGLKTAEDNNFLDEPGIHTATAQCKRHQRVISGGFEIGLPADGQGLSILTSKKVGKRGWTVTAADFDDPTTLTAFAYCQKKKKKKKA